MTRFTKQQPQQQSMFNQMTPEQQQQYRDRLAQRASQQQNWQPQGQHQQGPLSPSQQHQLLLQQQFNGISPEQQQQQYVRRQMQLRQQQGGQKRPNPMQFPVQSFNNTQLLGSSDIAPPSSLNYSGSSLEPETSPYFLHVSTLSSTNSLSGATGHGQQQRQNAAWSSSINGASISRPYAPSPPSASSTTPTLTMTALPQNGASARAPTNTSSPTQHGMSPTLSANSHMPTLPLFTMQTQSASPGSQRQQVNVSDGFTQSQQPRIPSLNAARYQQSPPKQGHEHAQTKQQASPTKRSSPPIAGQKRQATDAPGGTRPAGKRLNLMPRPGAVTHTTPVHQNASPSRQSAAYHQVNGMPNGTSNGVAPTTKDANRERQEQQARVEAKLEAERRRMREHQARAAEEARVAEQYRIAHAAALQREKDDKRKAELQKDPSANFRHILEVYKLMPLKKGELPNRYLTGLIANRSMPMDLDCDLALAITFAKAHWDYYGQWPKDIARFAGYEKERRAKDRS